MTLVYHEIEGWPKETWRGNDYRPERSVICDWSDRRAVAAELEGQEFAYAPGCGCYPYEISILPFDAQCNTPGAPLAVYTKAVITLTYSYTLLGGGTPSDVVIEELEPTQVAHHIDPSQTYWASDGEALAQHERPFVPRWGAVFRHKRNKMSSVPAAILSSANCCNSAPLSSSILGITFAAGTLMGTTPNVKRTWATDGTAYYSVTQEFPFAYNGGLGWNGIYRAKTGTYEYVKDASGNNVYDYQPAHFVLA